MIATCTNCEAKFRVDDAKVGPRGVKVKCSRCQTTFIVRPDATDSATVPEFSVGAAPFRAPLPPEPTPLGLRQPGLEFPVEFTPANEPSPLAPPLPPPLHKESARFDLGETDAEMTLPPPRPTLPADDAPPRRPDPPPLELMMPEPTPFGESGGDTLLDLAGPISAPPLSLDLAAADTFSSGSNTPAPQDLFDASFSSPLSPAPFADEPTRPMDAPLPDPLAGMPTFETQSEPDEGPQFGGGLSQEGIVTKNIDVRELRAHLQKNQLQKNQPVASIELAHPRYLSEKITKPQIMAPPRDASRQSSKVVGMLTAAAVVLVVAVLAIAYRAGGVQGLRTQTLPSPLSVERLSIIPYATHEGGRVWVLRGQVRNRSSDAHKFHVAVDGANQAVSAPAGVTLDAVALYDRGQAQASGEPIAQLAPQAVAEFTIALGAGDVSQPDALSAHAVVEF